MAGPIAYYEVRWRPSDSDGEWVYRTYPPESTSVTITGVNRVKDYVIEARSVGPSGLKSIWVNISHTVAGNAPPIIPQSVTATGVADGVKLSWAFASTPSSDTDTCVERGTSAGGPFTEILRVRSTNVIVTERTDGTFYYRLRTVNFRGSYSGYSAVVSGNPETLAEINASISTALTTAQNAQATADGKIDSFWQASPPVIGTGAGQAREGDIWFETDNGNKVYRVVSGAWTVAADDDMAQAINVAATAQATADGKVTTFYQSTAPSASAVGDLWFNTSTKVLTRWNGSSWADAGSTVNGTEVQNGVPAGAGVGKSLVTNGGFEANTIGAPLDTPLYAGEDICDGWFVEASAGSSGNSLTFVEYDTNATYTPSGLRNIMTSIRGGYTAPVGTVQVIARHLKKVPVVPGQKLYLSVKALYFNGAGWAAAPAGVTLRGRWGVSFYNSSSSYITGSNTVVSPSGSVQNPTLSVTVPATAAIAHFYMMAECINTNGSATVLAGTYPCDIRWDDFTAVVLQDLDNEVADGTVYGRYSVLDRFLSGGVYRLGLRVPGSTHRIGDQRNLPQSNTTAYGSVRSTTALSATSAGAVSVNAHSVRYGGTSVSYSAVSNAVTGLTQGVTYVIYCFDDNYAGGARTWYAGTNPDAVMQLGDGVVVAGQVTIPTSGSSSGGGGGTGDPGDWCVDYDTVLPDGRLVRELRLGDLVECIDVITGERGMFPLLGIGFGEEDCFRLVTPEFASVVQSRSTPMNLPDGRIVRTSEMFGRSVYAMIDGICKLTFICDLQYLGIRRVVKPDFGNRMFFAGEFETKTIATHNVTIKP